MTNVSLFTFQLSFCLPLLRSSVNLSNTEKPDIMKETVTPQELAYIFDALITKAQQEILAAKQPGYTTLNYEEIRYICDAIQRTYCKLMQVPQAHSAIVAACKEVLAWYLPIQRTSGLYPYPRPTMLDKIKKAAQHLIGAPAPDDRGVQKLRAAIKDALTQL